MSSGLMRCTQSRLLCKPSKEAAKQLHASKCKAAASVSFTKLGFLTPSPTALLP